MTTHWHVQRHADDDEIHSTGGLVEALGYAGTELDRASDYEYESITVHGDSGAYEDAYRSFQKSQTFAALAANAHNIHAQATAPREQRAPLYQVDDDQLTELIMKAAMREVREINAQGPAGFGIWQCDAPDCAPSDDDSEDVAVPDDFPVKVLGPDDPSENLATCLLCGRSWDDSVSTAYTPVPAGRCPFEAFH